MDIDANTVLAFDFETGTISSVTELAGTTGVVWSWANSTAELSNGLPMRGSRALYQNKMTGAYTQNGIFAHTIPLVAALRSNNWTVDFCLWFPHYSSVTNAMMAANGGVGQIMKFLARFSGFNYFSVQLQNYGRDLYVPISGGATAAWVGALEPFTRQHIVIRRNDANTLQLFVNGVDKGTSPCTQYATVNAENHEFWIGCHNVMAWYGLLVIDDFRVSNITRDDAWVAAQTSCEVPAPVPNLIQVNPRAGKGLGLVFDAEVGMTGPTLGAPVDGIGLPPGGVTQSDTTHIDVDIDIPPTHPLGQAEELPGPPAAPEVRHW